ncbi:MULTISPECIES: isochorismatase family cysteine hydrolase [unclassified Sphingomonas]|uniref:isochorismatase family cysteine hydrolase n=1 Tax=unclassified Sphingomonas TaxID=196159 RepID=UPI00092BA3B4|nr:MULTISPECIES: isochorismatase family cysteine hydrolase [unclassified Sphingomonas]MBN8850059.1 cysteine hydrolase [Sphingomonas sp.]OJV32248.1 MAG: isochorismatase [Sphingomonas sp. 67-36]
MATNAPIAPVRDQRGERTAMLVIDMINPFDFEGGAAARRAAERVSETIIRLRSDADAHDVPTIYVNDNFGEWHSDRDRLIEAARPNLSGGAIEPRAADFFVIKPQFSGFYSTNLAVLLPKLGVRRLILTGIATEICVLITAADAHMRDYALWVPADAVVPLDDDHAAAALDIMRKSMGAETAPAAELALSTWIQRRADPE